MWPPLAITSSHTRPQLPEASVSSASCPILKKASTESVLKLRFLNLGISSKSIITEKTYSQIWDLVSGGRFKQLTLELFTEVDFSAFSKAMPFGAIMNVETLKITTYYYNGKF